MHGYRQSKVGRVPMSSEGCPGVPRTRCCPWSWVSFLETRPSGTGAGRKEQRAAILFDSPHGLSGRGRRFKRKRGRYTKVYPRDDEGSFLSYRGGIVGYQGMSLASAATAPAGKRKGGPARLPSVRRKADGGTSQRDAAQDAGRGSAGRWFAAPRRGGRGGGCS